MNKWKLFDGAIILALDKRKNEWQELIAQCEVVGIEVTPFICGDGLDPELVYNRIDDVNPDVSGWGYGVPHLKHHHWNAFQTHQGMIKMAREKGYKSVLFLEDDAYITSRFVDVMQKVEQNLPSPTEWLLFYLGWWCGDENDEWNKKIEENYNSSGAVSWNYIKANFGGLHAVVIREELFDMIEQFKPNNPIDTQLCYYRDYIPSYYLEPKVIHIKSIHSYTEGCTFQRNKL